MKKKTVIVCIMIAIFAISVYVFETGEKDENMTANKPPPGVIGR